MFRSPHIALASLLAVVGLSAAPAQAALTSFANFTGIDANPGIRFQNSAVDDVSGTGGTLYTIDSMSSAPGSRTVSFSFLPSTLAGVNNVNATFTLTAATGSAAQTGAFLVQPNLAGSFSFLSTGAITARGITYAAGANLLSGTFNDVSIAGQNNASAASYGGSTGGGATIAFSSDFVTFNPVSSYDLSISLSSLAPLLAATPGSSLSSFEAYSTGSFSSDPSPSGNSVPEPAAWAMLIVGFGLVGVQTRGRRAANTTVAA
jgi:hypothetical protein